MALSHGITQQEVLSETIKMLLSRISDEGMAGFFRAIFLDVATGDAKYIAEAGRILQTITPLDVDRLGRFHYFAWQRALLYTKDRGSLMLALQNAHLPSIARLLGQHLARQVTRRPQLRAIKQIKKIALVSPYLASDAHPPTLMAIDQFSILKQQGIEVDMFSCQEAVGPEFDRLLGSGAHTPLQQVDLGGWKKIAGQNSKIHLGDQRFSLMRRWIDMLKNIAEFDPDVVVFVGLHSAMIHPLYEVRPVVGLCVNSIAPIAPTDVFLTAQKELTNKACNPWGSAFPESMAWYHPYRARRKSTGTPMPQQDLNVAENSVVLISVGSSLDIKIAGAWADRMCDTLARHPQAIWVLVGDKGELPSALKRAPPAQMRLVPRSSEVPAILACCDIYINPNTMGGGFSVAEAMAEGLPVMAYAQSDGGDKVDDEAVSTDVEYFAKLDALIQDRCLRKDIGNKMRARFNGALDLAQSGPSLMAACHLALKRYGLRTELVLKPIKNETNKSEGLLRQTRRKPQR